MNFRVIDVEQRNNSSVEVPSKVTRKEGQIKVLIKIDLRIKIMVTTFKLIENDIIENLKSTMVFLLAVG